MADFSPEAIAKSVHATLDEAYAAIPADRNHVLLLDATAGQARALYAQRVGKGWEIALEGAWFGGKHAAGKVSALKAWK